MTEQNPIIGSEAIAKKGWLRAHRWLLLRRFCQLGIIGLFLLPTLPSHSNTGFMQSLMAIWPELEGMRLVKGSLAYSMTLDLLPLTDPHILLQAILAGITPHQDAVIGVIIIVLFYLLVGGRVFCSWVCPVNMITDGIAWLQRKFHIPVGSRFAQSTRYWMLGLTLIMPLVTGMIVWELINPVSTLFRGLIYGLGMAWIVLLGVSLFDLFISHKGWCGKVCPVGAFYSLIGKISFVRVVANNRAQCDDCMECYAVCPEPQVIKPALKGETNSPIILSANCTNCGRCIDVCAEEVFSFGNRYSELEGDLTLLKRQI